MDEDYEIRIIRLHDIEPDVVMKQISAAWDEYLKSDDGKAYANESLPFKMKDPGDGTDPASAIAIGVATYFITKYGDKILERIWSRYVEPRLDRYLGTDVSVEGRPEDD